MTLSLNVKTRTVTGSKVNGLRQNGQVPAIVYGHGLKNQNITVPELEFNKVLKEAGESSLINLVVDKADPIQVLIHDLQYDPIRIKIQHIDFYQVRADEKITAEVNFHFVGDAPAIKDLSGILVTPLTKVKIECLPKDLIHELEVNLSGLKSFSDIIRVKDLIVPAGMEVLNASDEVVALVEEPRSEEEMKALEEKPEAKVEDIKTVKEEAPKTEEEAAPEKPSKEKSGK